VHRNDDTWIRSDGSAAPTFLDRLEQVVGALERELRRLDRDERASPPPAR
jgi:hypothetical protein